MVNFEQFRDALTEALPRLYDPDYSPPPLLCEVLGCGSDCGLNQVQAHLLRAISSRDLSLEVVPLSRLERDFDLLRHRFAMRQTQEEAAEALSISVRTVQRMQREAIHALALVLWQDHVPVSELQDWRAQAELELASLQRSAPDAMADVAQTLTGLLELGSALTGNPAVQVRIGYVQPDLTVAVHPSVLRQTLISVGGRLARLMSAGRIMIYAVLEDGYAKITLAATVVAGQTVDVAALTHEVLSSPESNITATIEEQQVFLYITLPSSTAVTVLTIDDNPDMLHFYRRCLAGTPYRVVQASSGREGLSSIAASMPDIILLDVMLPDIDGWQLLMRLHEDPATRAIPVVVCTVVREEELAFALGASCFLTKPVHPQRLVEALDGVRHPVIGRASKA